MSEARDFKEYVALYNDLRERFYTIREEGNLNHEYFEMDFLDINSNAWIPAFIKNSSEAVSLNFPEKAVDYTLDRLCEMEQRLNDLSPAPEH